MTNFPAGPPPFTPESLVFPPSQSMDTTATDMNDALTYVAQQNIFGEELFLGMASDDTTTTINIPTGTEVLNDPPLSVLAYNIGEFETGPSSLKNEKTDDAVFLTPLPVTSPPRVLTRITRKIPSADSSKNKIMKSLLSRKTTPCMTLVTASRQRECIVTASSQTPGVSASMPVLLRNLPSGTLTQRPRLQSAFVKTTTAADFIPRSSSVDNVITTHVSPSTAMTAAPQQSYAISPMGVATAGYTAFTTTVTTSTGKSIVLITNPFPQAPATRFKPPVQNWYKAKPDTAAKNFPNLVRSKALPDSPRATVASPTSITKSGPRSLIATAAVTATPVRPPPSTLANYTKYIPIHRKVLEEFAPGYFSVPLPAATQAQHRAESQAMTGLVRGAAPVKQHAVSRHDVREPSPARLVGISRKARLKDHQQALLVAPQPQKEYVTTSQVQGQSLVASRSQNDSLFDSLLQDQPVASRSQNDSLQQDQTVAARSQNDYLFDSLLQDQPVAARSQNDSLFDSLLQDQPVASRSQNDSLQQDQPVASRSQNDSLFDSLLQDQQVAARSQNDSLFDSLLQNQPVASRSQNDSLQQDQPVAARSQNDSLFDSLLQDKPVASRSQNDSLFDSLLQNQPLATSHQPNQLLATSQSQGPKMITSKQQAQGLAKSQSQGAILVAPQRQAWLATAQSQAQVQSHAIFPPPPNVTLPVQSKLTQANATLIAQLNAPPQKITLRGQQNYPRMLIHPNPEKSKKIAQTRFNAQAKMKTSPKRQQTTLPTRTQMISPPRQSAVHGQAMPCPVCQPGPPIVTQSATRETIAASTSLKERRPITCSASQKIGEVPSSSKQSTQTLTLSPGTQLKIPNYKAVVFKNLLAHGRGEPSPLPTPTTTSGEKIVIRRNTVARRSFPTTTQSLKAPATTTPKLKATAIPTHKTKTEPKPVRAISNVRPHMVAGLDPRHARTRSNNSQIPTIIKPAQARKKKRDEKREEETEENN